MIWQDVVLTIVGVILTIALIPQVIEGFKRKRGYVTLTTSAPTFIGLFVTSGVFYTLSLFMTSILYTVTGTLWLIIFIQRLIYKKG